MARITHTQDWFWSVRLAIIDLVALFFCGFISAKVRNYPILFLNFTWFDAFLVMGTCWIGLTIIGGYERNRDLRTLGYASEHLLAMGAVLMVSFVVTYVFSTYNSSVKPGRSVLFLALILFTPLSLAYRRVFSAHMRRRAANRFICVLGTREFASTMQAICREGRFDHPWRFIDIDAVQKAFSLEKKQVGTKDNPPLPGLSPEQISQCEGVVIDLSQGRLNPVLEEQLLNLNLHTIPVYPVDSFIETYFHKIDIQHVTLSWALDGTFKADHRSNYGKVKFLIDTIMASILSIILLPLMLLIALLIRGSDGGPALFKQVRVGRFDRPFWLYKFRTMKVGGGGKPYTEINDSRITAIGQLLRLTRFDELPQLWNVVKGDMSLIGPRAEWDQLADKYREEIPFYHLRHIVKPGITGWAQVNYGYGAGVRDAYEKLEYDLYYIKHCSLQMDASIVLKTLFTMLSAAGR